MNLLDLTIEPGEKLPQLSSTAVMVQGSFAHRLLPTVVWVLRSCACY